MLRMWLQHKEEARQGGGMSASASVDAEEADDAEEHDVAADEDEESRQGGLLVTHDGS